MQGSKQNGNIEMNSLDTKDAKELNGKHAIESAIETLSGEHEDISHTIWDTNNSTAV